MIMTQVGLSNFCNPVFTGLDFGQIIMTRVKVDLPRAASPPSWWPFLSDLPRLPAPFFFSLQYEEIRAVQGSRTYLPVIPSHRSSLWAAIVFFWAVFELLAVAPIRPSDRRLRSAGRDRVFPSSSYSDPLSVCERWCWCDRIGGVCSVLVVG
ncbi:hypothetical protein ACOSP7_028388 [Xanthoceras sorbifolium]